MKCKELENRCWGLVCSSIFLHTLSLCFNKILTHHTPTLYLIIVFWLILVIFDFYLCFSWLIFLVNFISCLLKCCLIKTYGIYEMVNMQLPIFLDQINVFTDWITIHTPEKRFLNVLQHKKLSLTFS